PLASLPLLINVILVILADAKLPLFILLKSGHLNYFIIFLCSSVLIDKLNRPEKEFDVWLIIFIVLSSAVLGVLENAPFSSEMNSLSNPFFYKIMAVMMAITITAIIYCIKIQKRYYAKTKE
ncbi:MAG TPA: hypothetical protein VJY62_20280, partial [Bacteroidia bacterium]|nr:hypothetical protein [Bacteroidia bacterium]